MRMQVAVTPTGFVRRTMKVRSGCVSERSLLDLSSVGGGRHRQRHFESPSDRFQLTVTHRMSMALKAPLPPSEEFRRVERTTDVAALFCASSLPSVSLESPFLLLAGITLHPLAKVNEAV